MGKGEGEKRKRIKKEGERKERKSTGKETLKQIARKMELKRKKRKKNIVLYSLCIIRFV